MCPAHGHTPDLVYPSVALHPLSHQAHLKQEIKSSLYIFLFFFLNDRRLCYTLTRSSWKLPTSLEAVSGFNKSLNMGDNVTGLGKSWEGWCCLAGEFLFRNCCKAASQATREASYATFSIYQWHHVFKRRRWVEILFHISVFHCNSWKREDKAGLVYTLIQREATAFLLLKQCTVRSQTLWAWIPLSPWCDIKSQKHEKWHFGRRRPCECLTSGCHCVS